MDLKKIAIPALIIFALLVSLIGPYNGLVAKREAVDTQWAQVENVYQRRADLIPNLVNTVKGYADFEKETLEAVIQARSSAVSGIDPNNLTEENLAKFQSSQSNLGSALSRLLIVVEKYPDLKANQNFLALQSQLEGTENRIAFERKAFNEIAQSYNTQLQTIPNNLYAGIFGFSKKAYFKADAGSEKAPEVKF
jgi:LemA protein